VTLISPADPPIGRLPWAWVARLAEAVRRLVTFVQERPAGRVAGLVANSSSINTTSTTETLIDYVNFVPDHTGRYRLEWGACLSGGASDAYNIKFRYEATAGALTTGGTQFYAAQIHGGGNVRREFHTKTLTGLVAGTQYAIGVLAQRASGATNLVAVGSAQSERTLDVFHIGGS
jgi:hypothetical protein